MVLESNLCSLRKEESSDVATGSIRAPSTDSRSRQLQLNGLLAHCEPSRSTRPPTPHAQRAGRLRRRTLRTTTTHRAGEGRASRLGVARNNHTARPASFSSSPSRARAACRWSPNHAPCGAATRSAPRQPRSTRGRWTGHPSRCSSSAAPPRQALAPSLRPRGVERGRGGAGRAGGDPFCTAPRPSCTLHPGEDGTGRHGLAAILIGRPGKGRQGVTPADWRASPRRDAGDVSTCTRRRRLGLGPSQPTLACCTPTQRTGSSRAGCAPRARRPSSPGSFNNPRASATTDTGLLPHRCSGASRSCTDMLRVTRHVGKPDTGRADKQPRASGHVGHGPVARTDGPDRAVQHTANRAE